MSDSTLELRSVFIDTITCLKSSMKQAMIENEVNDSPLLFFVLDYIQNIPNCTAQDITIKMSRDKGQVTRLIKELHAQGLVEKHLNEKDKRSNFISLTPSGLRYYQTLKAADNEAIQAMRQGISAEQFESFMTIGNKMIDNLKAHINK